MSKLKRNELDVSYLSADLTEQPMRTVLADRKRSAATMSHSLRMAAFRERAGVIGVLGSCLCAYPIRMEQTESGHSDWCPSAALIASQARAVR